ncbi:MAG: hypothetical protein WC117_03400 [Sphaerochaetaceae bacterium]
MRVDAHVHFCDASRFDELEKYRRLLSLDRVFLVSLPSMQRGNYNYAVRFAISRDPDHYHGYGCFDFRRTDFADQIRAMNDQGFSGLKLWIGKPSIQREMGYGILSKELEEAIRMAGSYGFGLIVHIADPPAFWEGSGEYSKGYPPFESYIADLDCFLGRYPQIRCTAAHLAFLAGGVEKLDSLMERHENLFLDTAPGRWFYREISEDPKRYSTFFEKYRQRIVVGSDSMFFDPDDHLFPYHSLDDNVGIFRTMEDFFFAEGSIDDPFPRPDAGKVLNLDLPGQVRELMIGDNIYELR